MIRYAVTENTSFGSIISVVISIQFRYHLIVISLSINLDIHLCEFNYEITMSNIHTGHLRKHL